MTCLLNHTEKVREMENEARLYWQVNELGWRLYRADPNDPELFDLRDEVEVIAQNTDWPRLREACHRALRIADRLLPKRAVS